MRRSTNTNETKTKDTFTIALLAILGIGFIVGVVTGIMFFF